MSTSNSLAFSGPNVLAAIPANVWIRFPNSSLINSCFFPDFSFAGFGVLFLSSLNRFSGCALANCLAGVVTSRNKDFGSFRPDDQRSRLIDLWLRRDFGVLSLQRSTGEFTFSWFKSNCLGGVSCMTFNSGIWSITPMVNFTGVASTGPSLGLPPKESKPNGPCSTGEWSSFDPTGDLTLASDFF
jgi:hypothetical protein